MRERPPVPGSARSPLAAVSLGALRVFDAAARHGSFLRAARELAVTASAVSHQIRTLESQIGVALFERRAREVRLTGPGLALAAGVRAGLERIEDALRAVDPAARGPGLTISMTPAFAARWFVPRLVRFEAPETIRVDARVAPVRFEEDGVDLAIRYGQGGYDGVEERLLVRERMIAVATPAVIERVRATSRATSIHVRWQRPAIAAPGWDVFRRGLRARVKLEDGPTFDDEALAILSALAGQGVALVSSVLVADELRAGALVQVWDRSVEGLSYHLVARRGAMRRPEVQRVHAWLRSELGASRMS